MLIEHYFLLNVLAQSVRDLSKLRNWFYLFYSS